jgi:hypothetical protein
VLCLASEGQAPVFRFANNGVDAFNLAVGRKRLADRRRVWCLDGRLLLDRRRPDACLGRKMALSARAPQNPRPPGHSCRSRISDTSTACGLPSSFSFPPPSHLAVARNFTPELLDTGDVGPDDHQNRAAANGDGTVQGPRSPRRTEPSGGR